LLAICHAFNAIQMAGVIHSEKYSAVRTAAIRAKKQFHLLGQQQFSIQNSKLLSLLNSKGFPYGKGNPIRFSLS